jgi:hypothetical protein
VSGTIPSRYNRDPIYNSCCALLILTDTSYSTYGNDDIRVSDFRAADCGRGTAPFTVLYPVVQISGNAAQPATNITLRDVTVTRSAAAAVYAQGAGGGMSDLRITGLRVSDTTDPNGYTGTPGIRTFGGVQLLGVHNATVKGHIEDTGAEAVYVKPDCTGAVDIDVVTKRINKAGKTGSCRIISVADGISTLDRATVKLRIEEQVAGAVSGQPYFISDTIFCISSPGIVRDVRLDTDKSVGLMNGPNLGISTTAITVGASPFNYANASGVRQLVSVRGGTVSQISRGRSALGITGQTTGQYSLEPGENLQVTYSVAPTMNSLALQAI